MRRSRSRSNLGLAVCLTSLAVLLSSCGSNDIDNLFSSGGGGFVADGPDDHAGHAAMSHAGAGGSAGHGDHAGEENRGGMGNAGSHARGGSGGFVASGGSAHAGSAEIGGTAGSAGQPGTGGKGGTGGTGGTAGHGGGSAGKGGSGGSAGKGGNSGNGGNSGSGGSAGSAGNAGSGGNAGNAGSAGSAGSAGGGNTGGTSGSGGSAGNGGNAGHAGSGGSGGAGAASCVDNSGCSSAEYCAKTSCGAAAEGHCTARPASCSGTKQATVCGCDGITYHDSCLLHANGQNGNPSSTGACTKGADGTLSCSSVDATACTAKGGLCAFKAELSCAPVPAANTGICWILPATCPGADDHLAHSCSSANDQSCTSECTVIRNQERYTLPNTCMP